MGISCTFGFHDWDGCKCRKCGKIRDEGHNWNGCKCTKCGKTRDEGHDWDQDCEKCSKCGAIRQNVHQWDGCKCTKCGKTRDEGHYWGKDCERCARCGAIRQNAHQWDGCKCSKCGKIRDEGHDWDGCKCKKCGKIRDEGHDWSKDCEKCSKCGKTRQIAHDWDGCICSTCGYTTIDKVYEALENEDIRGFQKALKLYPSFANQHLPYYQDLTLLHVAAQKNLPEAIQLLAEAKADVNIRIRSEMFTPLHWAAIYGCYESVETLLSFGAEVDARLGVEDGQYILLKGETPLLCALSFGHTSIASLLMKHGASPFIKTVNTHARMRIIDFVRTTPKYQEIADEIKNMIFPIHSVTVDVTPLMNYQSCLNMRVKWRFDTSSNGGVNNLLHDNHSNFEKHFYDAKMHSTYRVFEKLPIVHDVTGLPLCLAVRIAKSQSDTGAPNASFELCGTRGGDVISERIGYRNENIYQVDVYIHSDEDDTP